MAENRHLYRSDDTVIAGVCAGIAEYLGVDATLVRVIAAILLVLGAGSPTIIYLVLMFVMPRKPDDWSAPLDVEPVEPGQADAPSGPKPPEGAVIPPPPMTDGSGWAAYAAASQEDQSGRPQADAPGAAYSAAYSTVRDAGPSTDGDDSRNLWPVIIVGMVLICLGLGAFVNRIVPTFPRWGLWPLPLVACGIILALKKEGRSSKGIRIADGILIAVLGLVLLSGTLGGGSDPWGPLHMCAALWPLFVIAGGTALIGVSLRSRAFRCTAAVVATFALAVGFASYLSSSSQLSASGIGAWRDMGTVAVSSGSRGISVDQEDDGTVDINAAVSDAAVGTVPGFDVMLPSGYPYDMELNCGASNLTVDLSSATVRDMTLDAGMSQVDLTLGHPCDDGSTLCVQGGISDISLTVDEDDPVLVVVEGVSSKDIDSSLIYDEDAGGWVTSSYERAEAQGLPCWVCSIDGALLDVSIDAR